MSTHATISVKGEDGKVRSIYLHSDGYRKHAYEVLTRCYPNQEDADELVALGDLSRLLDSPKCPPGHSFDNPAEGHCVAYDRDRGESGTEARVYDNTGAADRDAETYHWYFDGHHWERY